MRINLEVLKKEKLFINYKLVKNDNGDVTKPPFNPNNSNNLLNITDSSQFVDYYTAYTNVEQGVCDGVGIVLTDNQDYALCGIDIDLHKGESNIHIEELKMLFEGTYMEISPSGNGLHILFLVKKSEIPTEYNKKYLQKNSKEELECYVGGIHKRYLTFTENTHGLEEYPICDETASFLKFINKYMKKNLDEEIEETSSLLFKSKKELEDFVNKRMDIARRSKHGELVVQLYDRGDSTGYASESEARQRLCGLLAFWLSKSKEAMIYAYKKSALYCEGKAHDLKCIDNAINSCTSCYGNQKNSTSRFLTELALDKSVANNSDCLADNNTQRICIQENGINIVTEYFEKLKNIDPDANLRYNQWTDTSNAELFAKLIEDKAIYVNSEYKWYIYDSGVWKKDTGNTKIERMLNYIIEALNKYFQEIVLERMKNPDESINFKEKLKKVCVILRDWSDFKTKRNLIDAAKPYNEKKDNLKFDENELVFNVSNGTIELRMDGSYVFRKPSPDDCCTKKSPVIYDPDVDGKEWDNFMDEITSGDKGKAGFLKRLSGCCLSGKTYEECFFLFLGESTRNGKTTFINSIESVYADYGVNNQNEAIVKCKFKAANGHSEQLARLYGKRFYRVSELPQDAILDFALVKQITGNDTITVRKPYEKDSFEFKPNCKLIIVSNYALQIDDPTIFESNRLKVITFNRYFKEDEQNVNLKEIFQTSKMQSAILNWMLDGWTDYCKVRLKMPKSVEDETKEYYYKQDSVARFIDEHLKEVTDGEVNCMQAYQLYRECMLDKNGAIIDYRHWAKLIESKGISIVKKRPKNSGGIPKGATATIIGYKLIDKH